ncbi:MAG: LD-carboxypeptidase, partial [Bacteroidota bacterium]
QRLDDLHQMFADPEIDGIWCVRGGYGCTRILPHIDYKLIRKNPKVIIGYSDITALLQGIHQETGLIGFHGPVGTSDFTDYTLEQMQAVVMQNKATYTIPFFDNPKALDQDEYRYEVIHPGVAEGELAGGNLSLLAAMTGTDFECKVKGKLLFIEDVGEQPYRIDRMLTQIQQNQNLNDAAGIVLGVFNDCKARNPEYSLTLMECLKDQLAGLRIPVIYGFSFGHISNQCTFPIGIRARLDTTAKTVTLLESSLR